MEAPTENTRVLSPKKVTDSTQSFSPNKFEDKKTNANYSASISNNDVSKTTKNVVDISSIKTTISARFPDLERSVKMNRIAFPPFCISGCVETSTASITVDVRKVNMCAESICKAIAKFLLAHKDTQNLELVLVISTLSIFHPSNSTSTSEYSRYAQTIAEIFTKYKAIYCKDERFIIKSSSSEINDISVANLQALGIPCTFIANESNWRFKCGSSITSKQLYKLCEIKDQKGSAVSFLDQVEFSLVLYLLDEGN